MYASYNNYENPTQVEFENLEDFFVTGAKQGTIEASFAQLEAALGKPGFEGVGDNITTQFNVRAKFYDNSDTDFDGLQFTLYDWHYSRNLRNDYEVTEWNVGGEGYGCTEAADRFSTIINDTNNYLEDIDGLVLDVETDIMIQAEMQYA